MSARRPLALALFAALSSPLALAADVVVTPSAGSGFVVKDNTGASDRLRVSEAGAVSVPAVPAAATQTTAVCMSAVGLLGPCGAAATSLPISGTSGVDTPLIALTQSSNTVTVGPLIGNGPSAARFVTSGGTNWPTVAIDNAGRGSALDLSMSNPASGAAGIVMTYAATGTPLFILESNAANPNALIDVTGNGTGPALSVSTNGVAATNIALFGHNGVKARIDGTGKGFFNGGTQTGGADVAEIIPHVGAPPRPGDVVMIDPEHPLHYKIADRAASTQVAGVVTTKPGVLMNAGVDAVDGEPALALVGRVPVKVSNEGGAIRPGDLLVSSSTPGHAMKAPAAPAPGTIVGKALEPFDAATGTVEMLVMLR